MKIIADENLHSHFSDLLREQGHEVVLIANDFSGFSDEQVIQVVQQLGDMLVTEDKDFGELIFAHRIAKVTIVFLRFRKPELEKIAVNLLKVVQDFSQMEGEYFITITSTRIRIRSI